MRGLALAAVVAVAMTCAATASAATWETPVGTNVVADAPVSGGGYPVSFLVRNLQFQESVRYSLQGLSLFPLFVVAVRYPGTWKEGPHSLLPALSFIGCRGG